jgi:cellulose biosynthesis protein BcsQ
MRNLVVAVWGGKSSGKTTFAAALAQELTKHFWLVLLVSADRFQPAFSVWQIDSKFEIESIGKILSYPDITEDYLKKNIVYQTERLGFMGYPVTDDYEQNNPISGNAAKIFLREVKKIVQIAVVDCTMPQIDMLTEKALEKADIVVMLHEPNNTGYGFLHAQYRFNRRNTGNNRYMNLASKVAPTTDIEEYEKKSERHFLSSFCRIRRKSKKKPIRQNYSNRIAESTEKP